MLACHANGPLIRTPHYYWNPGSHAVLPAKEAKGAPYFLANATQFQVGTVEKTGNACTTCHDVGVYRTSQAADWQLGAVNRMAAGEQESITSGARSPTMTGYYDFMANHVSGGRAAAVKALKELETCIAAPATAGCKITRTFTQPYKYGRGIRFRARHLALAGGGESVTVAPNASIAGKIDIDHDCPSCGGAINQIIVGLAGDSKARACIWQGQQSSGGWKPVSFSLNAPRAPGTYALKMRYAQANNCKDALGWWTVDMPGGPGDFYTIGTVTVQ